MMIPFIWFRSLIWHVNNDFAVKYIWNWIYFVTLQIKQKETRNHRKTKWLNLVKAVNNSKLKIRESRVLSLSLALSISLSEIILNSILGFFRWFADKVSGMWEFELWTVKNYKLVFYTFYLSLKNGIIYVKSACFMNIMVLNHLVK